MEKDNCELLFEYLRSILYDQQIHALDVKELDEPYQKLGRNGSILQRAVKCSRIPEDTGQSVRGLSVPGQFPVR